ncbi:MAG: MBL fold metallo-hydrolase [Gammaproteobacteria bacterium]|nr:MAG: MBL fold metallo-hydrolase [Gammaproteobacteria bacterium]
MYTLLRCLFLILLPVIAIAAERGPAVPEYPADRIADRIYVIHGPLDMPNPENQGFMNNPGIILTDAGMVLVDPGASVQSGEMVLRVAGQLSDQPVVAVFNTHIHGDHWLGNQAVRAAYPDVAIYGHPNMIELIENGEGKSWVALMEQLTEGKTKGTKVVPPNKPLNHGEVIKVGDHTFRIHHYGPAHTTSDIMIEIVEPGVVFLGDNVLSGRVPRIREGNIQGNIKACEEIVKTDASVYVPGHGKTGDRDLVEIMKTWFSTIYGNVERLYAEDQSDFEMKDEISALLQDYSGWIGFDEQLGKHISFAYLQIEADNF